MNEGHPLVGFVREGERIFSMADMHGVNPAKLKRLMELNNEEADNGQ